MICKRFLRSHYPCFPSNERNTDMTQPGRIGWAMAFLCVLAAPAWAVEYRLQIVNLDFLTVSAYTDPSTPGQAGEGSLNRLEARLDRMEFATGALIPGREVLLLDDPRYGGIVPNRLSTLPATQNQAWTTLVWDANPGDTIAFVVKSDTPAWQEVWSIGGNPEGTLRRLSLGGPSLFGGRSYEVPQVAYDFLANAVDRGTFPNWLAQNARALNGMSLAIGQGRHRIYNPDRVYVALKLAAEPRTYKVVIGWRDYNDRGTDSKDRFSTLLP
jgi:hypothetical protein